MKVVLICHKNEFDRDQLARLKKACPVVWYDQEKVDLSKVPELYDDDAKILAMSPVPLSWVIPKEIYPRLKNVHAICLPTTGYDFIDSRLVTSCGIEVTNVPYYSTNSVAEYAIFMMLALIKRFPIQMQSGFAYEFTDSNLAEDYHGKLAGIVGLGHIGNRIADLAEGMGMKVAYWSQSDKESQHQRHELEDLIVEADVLFPAYALNDSTNDLLNKTNLIKLKKSAYVVSILHGGLPTDFLTKRVQSGDLSGFAFTDQASHKIEYTGNIFVTPPLAWYSKESLANNVRLWTDTVLSYVKGEPKNRVL